MRTKIYRVSLAIVALLVIITSIFAFNYINKNNSAPEDSIVQANEYMYYLKEYEQKIGIYKVDETSPFKTIDVYVSTLPSVDQQELKSGIMVQNDSKLRTLIEDYES